jgi:TatA/E family protein of Tat protein translocase
MNVLGMGPMEILLIVVLALIVFGPAKLPEIMGQVGKAINDFRRATSQLSDEFNRTIQTELKETRSVIDETKSVVTEAHTSVTSAVSGLPAPTRAAAPTETAPVPSGTGPEAVNNGAVPGASTPPLADTSQWSWETAAPAASTPGEASAAPAEVPAATGSSDGAAASRSAEVPASAGSAEAGAAAGSGPLATTSGRRTDAVQAMKPPTRAFRAPDAHGLQCGRIRRSGQ